MQIGKWVRLGCVGLLTACGAAPAPSGAEEESSLELNLTTTAASGTQYRLGPATFEIEDLWRPSNPPLVIDASGEQARLHVPVQQGSYRVSLERGWTLSRLDGTTLVPVAATLTSQAEQDVTVEPYQAAPVTFAFHLGESGIDIGVTVDEGIAEGYDARLVPAESGYYIEFRSGGSFCCVQSLAEARAVYPNLNIQP
jgi:hypothetical protein